MIGPAVCSLPLNLIGKALTESEWAKTVRDTAATFGWRAYHTRFSIGSDRGYPDDHFWHPRPHVGYWMGPGPCAFLVEYKKQSGKVSLKQADCIDSLVLAGYQVYVWRPSDWEQVVQVLSFGRARAG